MDRARPLALSLALIAASLACAPGCGGRAQSPRSALEAYANALAEGRADDAYALLSKDARTRVSKEEFRGIVARNKQEAYELGKSLARESSDPYVTAVVPLKNGDKLLMVYEDGVWRVDASALDFYSQATPKQAIAGFVRAFENRRWDVLLRYTPDAHKEGLTPERLAEAWDPQKPEGKAIDRNVQQIKQVLETAKIEETGDRATMSLGPGGGLVMLVREHGLWKVEDIK